MADRIETADLVLRTEQIAEAQRQRRLVRERSFTESQLEPSDEGPVQTQLVA